MMITEMKVRGDRGIEYTISASLDGGIQCTCPDHLYRGRQCKHIDFAIATVVAGRQAAAGPSLVSVPRG